MSNDYLIEAEALHALARQPEVFIIDTRDELSYRESHIPGAININRIFTYLCTNVTGGYPAMAQEFTTIFRAAGLERNHPVVVYEDAMDNGYGQSCRGWFILKYLGHPNVKVLHGGLRAWTAKQLPLTTDKPAFPASAYEPQLDSSMLATAEDVVQAIGNPDIALVDVRDYAEWLGANSSPYGYDFCPRKGRIPGARWLEWYKVMRRKGGVQWFKSPEEIRALAAEIGLTPDSRIYFYCFKGARTSNVTLAFKMAGFKNVQNYFSSWNEWSRDFSLPIEEGYPAEDDY